jgi:uncharacterized protein (TIRG00374 family)
LRKQLLLGLKLAVSALLLALMLRHVEWRPSEAQLTAASIWLLACAGALLAIAVSVAAWRWQLVLRVGGGAFGLGRLVPYAFVGYFFNQALPSTIGGDGVRAWLIYRDGASASLAVRSVIIERVLGLMVLLAFSAAGLPRLLAARGLGALHIWSAVVLVGVSLAGGVVALMVLRDRHWLDSFRIAHSDEVGRGFRAKAATHSN